MPEGRLYIGNRRYSSWSMRGWLAVKLAGLDVEEVMIYFSRPGPTAAIGKLSPNGLVPYLEHRGARVWESLAVCEVPARRSRHRCGRQTQLRGLTRVPSARRYTPDSPGCGSRCG